MRDLVDGHTIYPMTLRSCSMFDLEDRERPFESLVESIRSHL